MLRFKKSDGSDFPKWEEKTIKEFCIINPKTECLDDEFYYIDLEDYKERIITATVCIGS